MVDQRPDVYQQLRTLTDARLALQTTGSSLATSEWLTFQYDWARARDAVYYQVDWTALSTRIEALGFDVVQACSAALSREVYLRRPDLGRKLASDSEAELTAVTSHQPDVAVVIADGLSGQGVDENAVPVLDALGRSFAQEGWGVAPVVLVSQGRVAVGDPIGAALGARMTVVLIGERPGLSAADSLGAYLTFQPGPGRTDAERNCVSNIRPGGQPPESAAGTIAHLVARAFAKGQTGVALKDETMRLSADPE